MKRTPMAVGTTHACGMGQGCTSWRGVPLRTAVTITLSGPGHQLVYYIVGLNSTPPVIPDPTAPPSGWTSVKANPDGAETTTQLTFHRPGPNTIYAYAVDSTVLAAS